MFKMAPQREVSELLGENAELRKLAVRLDADVAALKDRIMVQHRGAGTEAVQPRRPNHRSPGISDPMKASPVAG